MTGATVVRFNESVNLSFFGSADCSGNPTAYEEVVQNVCMRVSDTESQMWYVSRSFNNSILNVVIVCLLCFSRKSLGDSPDLVLRHPVSSSPASSFAPVLFDIFLIITTVLVTSFLFICHQQELLCGHSNSYVNSPSYHACCCHHTSSCLSCFVCGSRLAFVMSLNIPVRYTTTNKICTCKYTHHIMIHVIQAYFDQVMVDARRMYGIEHFMVYIGFSKRLD